MGRGDNRKTSKVKKRKAQRAKKVRAKRKIKKNG
jgi:hypothetical protein